VNIAKVNAMNNPMFQDDILCVRCGYWYISEVLSDEEHICPSCLRGYEKRTNKRELWSRVNSELSRVMKLADLIEGEAYVYFVQGVKTRLVKVGYTNDVVYRIKNHQVGSPDILECLGYVYGSYALEGEIHRALSPLRVHGEWFQMPPMVLNCLMRRINRGLPLMDNS
jgi:hypothetical protein